MHGCPKTLKKVGKIIRENVSEQKRETRIKI